MQAMAHAHISKEPDQEGNPQDRWRKRAVSWKSLLLVDVPKTIGRGPLPSFAQLGRPC